MMPMDKVVFAGNAKAVFRQARAYLRLRKGNVLSFPRIGCKSDSY